MSVDATSIRYARQRTLTGFGLAGQNRVVAARVLVIGAGGLGCAVLPTLAAAGVGTIVLVDDDVIDESNLHRQTLFTSADVGLPKVTAAARALRRLSPEADIEPCDVHFDAGTVDELAAGADLIVDASDSMAVRYLANDTAARLGVPLVWGNAIGWTGQVGVAWDARGADYRDLFPDAPDTDAATCSTLGVLPSVCTVVGGFMTAEVLKLLTGSAEGVLVGRVLYIDVLGGKVREVGYQRSAARHARPGDAAASRVAATPAGFGRGDAVTAAELRMLLGDGDPLVLVDVREGWEAELSRIDGSVLIPLGELPDRLGELDPGVRTIVYCQVGGRSAQALDMLQSNGFADAHHLTGGIVAWLQDAPADARRS